MEFVAFLGNDKENWGQVKALMTKLDYERAILIKNKETDKFPANAKTHILNVDSAKSLIDLKSDILKQLRPKLSGEFDIALSIASGTGKEHMAVISALLAIPVGIRLVVYTKGGVEFLS